MDNPLFSMAMSVHANPGVYALLLGSGVSRAAGIPTGWEVVEDLVRRVAALSNEECGSDPAAWYRQKFGNEPNYSVLLDAVAKSPSERQQLLRSYFEPTDDQREQGLKQPTAAHRAIARLVAKGYIRVILTTNFDRLIERAIEDEGVAPTVISTPDAIEGALPLVHQRCCVVKLHGDYLDTRIKNTPSELDGYDARVDRLLNQVFDEFGLIVSGWSGDWDTALRAALERCPSRRFTLFWASRGEPGSAAKPLIQLRGGQTIVTPDADTLFTKLDELVTALIDSRRLHPSSVEATVALAKRYLSSAQYHIRLYDLVLDEAEAASSRLTENDRCFAQQPENRQDVEAYLARQREIVETCERLIIELCVFSGPQHHSIVIDLLERLARAPRVQSGRVFRESLRQHAVALVYSAACLTAVARKKYDLLGSLFTKPTYREQRRTAPLLLGLNWEEMAARLKQLATREGHPVPLSEYLFVMLREPLRRWIPDYEDYDEVFDRFEYIRALVYADMEHSSTTQITQAWALPGRFAVKLSFRSPDALEGIQREIEEDGQNWPLLKQGLFRGSVERLTAIQLAVERDVHSHRW